MPHVTVLSTPPQSHNLFNSKGNAISNAQEAGKLDDTVISIPASPPSLSSPFSISVLKDQRAYEHDRQRIKRSAELVKTKARKDGWLKSKLSTATSIKHKGALENQREPHWTPSEFSGDVAGVRGYSLSDNLKNAAMDDIRAKPEAHGTEVKLADLISRANVRKGQAGDFEVIPHIRSVIALDDVVSHDIDVDEPWEYIQADDFGAPTHIDQPESLSYAHAVLAMAK